jgi:CBS domain containing-hemolysin-like protein
MVVVALNLIPFAGIAFLWFIGVVRDRLGQHEDRFFATVFLGSGLLFVTMLFVAGAVTAALIGSLAGTGTAGDVSRFGRGVGSVVLHTYAMRMGAVFTISTATIGLRTGFIPRWLGFSGYAIALVLLLAIGITLWVELLFPLWILLFSLDTLVRSLAGGAKDRPSDAAPRW